MADNQFSHGPRAAARAVQAEIEASHPSDTYLRTALSMILLEIERSLAQLGPTSDEASAKAPEDVRLKVYVAIVELVALQLGTGRFQEGDGTWSVLGEGLHRLQSLACGVLQSAQVASPEIRDALAKAGRHTLTPAPFRSA